MIFSSKPERHSGYLAKPGWFSKVYFRQSTFVVSALLPRWNSRDRALEEDERSHAYFVRKEKERVAEDAPEPLLGLQGTQKATLKHEE